MLKFILKIGLVLNVAVVAFANQDMESTADASPFLMRVNTSDNLVGYVYCKSSSQCRILGNQFYSQSELSKLKQSMQSQAAMNALILTAGVAGATAVVGTPWFGALCIEYSNMMYGHVIGLSVAEVVRNLVFSAIGFNTVAKISIANYTAAVAAHAYLAGLAAGGVLLVNKFSEKTGIKNIQVIDLIKASSYVDTDGKSFINEDTIVAFEKALLKFEKPLLQMGDITAP